LRGFYSIVRFDDLERFNRDHGFSLEPYPLAAYGCLVAIVREYSEIPAEIIFDHVENVSSKLRRASCYAEADNYWRKELEFVSVSPLAKELTFKNVRAIQAADFVTWEIQRNHLNADDWFSRPGKPTEEDARWNHFVEWSRATFGIDRPPTRKSFEAVIEGGAPVTGIIWDYHRLCEAHRQRGGVWS
jgi:hypothetical protein